MTSLIPTAKKLMIGSLAVATVALGTAGVAGAAPTTPAHKGSHHHNCARAPKMLSRISSVEASIAAGLPKLNAAEARAQQNGNTKRADRIKRRITRMESAAFKARLAKRAAAIEAKCHVSAPPAKSSSATTPTSASTGDLGSTGTATSA